MPKLLEEYVASREYYGKIFELRNSTFYLKFIQNCCNKNPSKT